MPRPTQARRGVGWSEARTGPRRGRADGSVRYVADGDWGERVSGPAGLGPTSWAHTTGCTFLSDSFSSFRHDFD
eukprot:2610811-Prymnesium_polylepis.1